MKKLLYASRFAWTPAEGYVFVFLSRLLRLALPLQENLTGQAPIPCWHHAKGQGFSIKAHPLDFTRRRKAVVLIALDFPLTPTLEGGTMSVEKIQELGLPEHLIKRLMEECDLKDITPSELIVQALTKRFPAQSPHDKLALLRDVIKKRYAV